VAVALTLIVPDTIPAVGAVILTAGGVTVFCVVTLIPVEVFV
jgi:hypothetical protein